MHFRLLWGPATTEIDSPHLRGRRRLNRRVNLILSQSPSTDVYAWKFTGNRCGSGAGLWELGRVSLRSMASGSGRPVRGPHPRDMTSQTQTLAAPEADATAIGRWALDPGPEYSTAALPPCCAWATVVHIVSALFNRRLCRFITGSERSNFRMHLTGCTGLRLAFFNPTREPEDSSFRTHGLERTRATARTVRLVVSSRAALY